MAAIEQSPQQTFEINNHLALSEVLPEVPLQEEVSRFSALSASIGNAFESAGERVDNLLGSARTKTAIVGAAAVAAFGVIPAEAATNIRVYPNASTNTKDNTEALRLYKKCGTQLHVNQPDGVRSSPNKQLKVRNINGGNRQMFSWDYRSNKKFCGILAYTLDDKAMVVSKPTKNSLRRGHFTDPQPQRTGRSIGTFVLYLQPR